MDAPKCRNVRFSRCNHVTVPSYLGLLATMKLEEKINRTLLVLTLKTKLFLY